MFSVNFQSSVIVRSYVLALTLLVLAGCSPVDERKESHTASSHNNDEVLTIYKDPNCGCCEKWIEHLSAQGLQSDVINQTNMGVIKQKYGVATRYRSCHTALSLQGYVFEGHVPAKFINQFLTEKPIDALGLAVPAMPVGSLGMEVGDKFMPYHILLLKADGSHEIYAEINQYQEQF
ncbi:DUF411 domain-containing protein [Colwellia sp. RSH04]|uniref:DUF411 domain-containing protein n=1 Tax=Colwellia sp. RSH04 TaxID=2305464 RepID=UPI000E56FACF|nr:DUF411 domain-containing protein [Colwellia sp. RSH04]RHW77602.1 DUF411 domain-containing protein [Colwellia sp. RSH04]